MFETCIEMRLQAELNDDWVMVTVYVSIDPVQPLEDLTNQPGEGFWERQP